MKSKFTYPAIAVATFFLIAVFAFKNDDPIEKLRKEMNGKISNLQNQVSSLKTTVANQKEEFSQQMTEFENDLSKKALPIGSIVAYDKEANTIPNGWMLCNGATVTDQNSPFYNRKVPNLVDYFVRGKKNNESLEAKGGTDLIAGHTHTIGSHRHTVDGHDHSFTTNENRGGSWSTTITYVTLDRAIPNGDAFTNHTQKVMWLDDYGQYNGYHTHSGTTNNSSWQYTSEVGSQTTSSSASETNVPEYIALNYIIKIK
jgi:microcystin-dependent protein